MPSSASEFSIFRSFQALGVGKESLTKRLSSVLKTRQQEGWLVLRFTDSDLPAFFPLHRNNPNLKWESQSVSKCVKAKRGLGVTTRRYSFIGSLTVCEALVEFCGKIYCARSFLRSKDLTTAQGFWGIQKPNTSILQSRELQAETVSPSLVYNFQNVKNFNFY